MCCDLTDEMPSYAEGGPGQCSCCVICSQVIEKKEHIDFKRHALFCCFGFGYLGCFQYWLYNVKFVQVSNVCRHTLAATCHMPGQGGVWCTLTND